MRKESATGVYDLPDELGFDLVSWLEAVEEVGLEFFDFVLGFGR